MKKLLFILLLATVCLEVEAQPYQSIFGQTSTEWVLRWGNTFGEATDTFYITHDTVVHGKSYKKLVFQHPNTLYKGGLLREDTMLGKVWYKGLRSPTGGGSSFDTVERLAFDFSLQAGDSADVSNINTGPPGAYNSTWNIVDSIAYIGGMKHVYFRGAVDWYDPLPHEPITFIEGVGSNVSPMFKHYSSPILFQYLLCSYKDNVRTFYTNRRYNGSCTLPTSVSGELATEDAIVVFPNPTSDVVHVECPASEKLTSLALFNLTGQRMGEPENSVNELSVKGLPPGVYFLQIRFADKPPLYRRIVVR